MITSLKPFRILFPEPHYKQYQPRFGSHPRLDHNQDLDQNSTTSDYDVLTCKICVTNKITKVLIPCGHSACYECVFKLQTCPICKDNFTKIHNLFI